MLDTAPASSPRLPRGTRRTDVLDQIGEQQQVVNAKSGPLSTDDLDRVPLADARPLRRQRPQAAALTVEVDSLPTPVAAVLEELKRRNTGSSSIRERKLRVNEYSKKRREAFEDASRAAWNNVPIDSIRLMSELDQRMAADAYVVSEIVTNDRFIRQHLSFDHTRPFDRRRRNFDTVSGVLGWGLAASIGVKIGNPRKEVWCLTGDGSLNFGNQALWSAVRYEVPIGIIVFNNGQYQANRLNQNRYKGRMLETGKYIGVDLGHPDISYVSMAKTYGLEGERIDKPGKIAAALQRCQRAMHDGRPYLVDVRIGNRGAGSDSDWYDFFSIARNEVRSS